MKLFLKELLLALMAIVVVGFWQMYFSERPKLTIDPVTLAGDGSLVDYCKMPTLDGQGKLAMDIPKGNTPDCAYDHFPLPILAECTEPLSDRADDVRGLWKAVTGKVGHIERIEQCGSRIVVTTAGVIHDLGPNSTGGLTSNDTDGAVLFTIGDKEFCPRTSAGVKWNEGVLNFYAFGWGPVVVKRYREGEQLVWEYVDGSITRMNRICQIPAEDITPKPRGLRYRLF